MSSKRKISIRKVIQTVVTMVAVSGCVLAMLSADRRQHDRTIKAVHIRLRNASQVKFLDENAISDMLFASRHLDPLKQRVNRTDVHTMEEILQSNPWVRDAQVYVDADAELHVSVEQRMPVVRVFEESGDSYYLDTALQTMPLCPRFSSYVPVVTGVARLRNDSAGRALRSQIIGLVSFFGRNPFWNAQVSQVIMRPDRGFELIPILGTQRIILGDTSGLQEKLGNLFAFYKQVQNRLGWDKYRIIDLRYEGQVVASPALKWKIPVDRAISNVNWVKAIMDAAPNRQEPGGDANAIPDSTDHAAPASAHGPTASLQQPNSSAAGRSQQADRPSKASALSTQKPSNKSGRTIEKKPAFHAKNTSRHAVANR